MPDNPTTASPVRSAEVEVALQNMQTCADDGYIFESGFPKELLSYIAQLEAQPKPQSDEGLREAVTPLVEAAYAMTFGTDWNKGNTAIMHGWRQKLIDAVPAARAALSQAPVPRERLPDELTPHQLGVILNAKHGESAPVPTTKGGKTDE